MQSKMIRGLNLFIAACSISILCLFFFPRITHAEYKTSVASTGRPIHLVDGSQICNAWRSLGGTLLISGSASIKNTGTYQNLFQTDDLNNGLRLELSPDFNLGLVVGNAADSDISVVDFGKIRDISRNLDFKIQLRNEAIKAEINGTNSLVQMPTRATCANLLVGQGYDESRLYGGEIVVSFTSTFEAPPLIRERYGAFILIMQISLALSSAILLIHAMRNRSIC